MLELDSRRLDVFPKQLLDLSGDVLCAHRTIETIVVVRLALEAERLIGQLATKNPRPLLALEKLGLEGSPFLGKAGYVVFSRLHSKPTRQQVVASVAVSHVDDFADVTQALDGRCQKYLGDLNHPCFSQYREIVESPHLFVKLWLCQRNGAMVYSLPMIDLAQWEEKRSRVLVMGIVNVTPNSFHDGGRHLRREDAIERGVRMADEGADIVDVGGESTRPGSEPVPTQVEMDRVLPVVEGIRRRSPVLVSIDTTKADVAKEAIRLGAGIVNDISALRFDARMAATAAEAGAFVVLMHMQGRPETMQQDPIYSDIIAEVRSFLVQRTRVAVEAGIPEERIVVDPGIGFGKTLEHNLTLLRNLSRLVELGRPVLVGASRKAFLGAILDLPTSERIEGTIVADTTAILNGASVIRVHDVKEGRRTADVAARLRGHASR